MAIPHPTQFTAAPLRNRLRLELAASPSAVWGLVGDLARLPEYSDGLDRVEAKTDSAGRCESYVCYFKPMGPSAEGIVSHEVMRWWEPELGWASSGAQPDAFELADDLNLVTLETAAGGTNLTWDVLYDARDLAAMKAHFDEALADIGDRLVGRFGGRVIERYIQD